MKFCICFGLNEFGFSFVLNSLAVINPEFVNDIVDLIWKYNGDKKLHDDVTMMIAKVGY